MKSKTTFLVYSKKILEFLLFKGSMPERLMGVDCKSTSFTYAGSNPARSIQFLNVFWFIQSSKTNESLKNELFQIAVRVTNKLAKLKQFSIVP